MSCFVLFVFFCCRSVGGFEEKTTNYINQKEKTCKHKVKYFLCYNAKLNIINSSDSETNLDKQFNHNKPFDILLMYLVSGNNLFGQWLVMDPILKNFQSMTLSLIDKDHCEVIHVGWSYNLIRTKDKLFLCGFFNGQECQLKELNFSKLHDLVTCISTGNDDSLIIADPKADHIFWVDINDHCIIKEVKFKAEIKDISPEEHKSKKPCSEGIIKIALTNHLCLLLMEDGTVYCGRPPTYLDTSLCVGNVIDIKCGYEHYILLTNKGRVYTWGNGRHLQLGHGDITNYDIPAEVEALAGIKITKVAAGGWHTLAISEFGDLYAWGWNDVGQLGIKNDKGTNSYSVPTIVDLFKEDGTIYTKNVEDIACGSRHSAIILEDNTVWTTGCNNFGQLGLPLEDCQNVFQFTNVLKVEKGSSIHCGLWSSVVTVL